MTICGWRGSVAIDAIATALLFLCALGLPFAWRKFHAGLSVGWVGYHLDIQKKLLGIGANKTRWLFLLKILENGCNLQRVGAKQQACHEVFNAPAAFLAGEPFRATASLELLATVAAVVCFGLNQAAGGSFHGSVVCSTSTDNWEMHA